MTDTKTASADARPIATDALGTLGMIIPENSGRDAIHLAVEPVIAAERLFPGQHIGFVDGGVGTSTNPLGIVDPFLSGVVNPGQRFWMVIYPRTITALRHVWEHPAFSQPAEPPTERPDAVSEAWLRNYAGSIDLTFNTLMNGADDWVRTHDNKWGGEYLVQGGTLEGVSTHPEFWKHYEILRSVVVPENAQTSFFSCSC